VPSSTIWRGRSRPASRLDFPQGSGLRPLSARRRGALGGRNRKGQKRGQERVRRVARARSLPAAAGRQRRPSSADPLCPMRSWKRLWTACYGLPALLGAGVESVRAARRPGFLCLRLWEKAPRAVERPGPSAQKLLGRANWRSLLRRRWDQHLSAEQDAEIAQHFDVGPHSRCTAS
jgi:hypothetical protein